ncbi:MAG: hypothetical protein RSC66_11645, partial [Comamonas sp.]
RQAEFAAQAQAAARDQYPALMHASSSISCGPAHGDFHAQKWQPAITAENGGLLPERQTNDGQ